MTSDNVLSKLLEAFEQDHVMLGRGFNQLSCCLRAGDSAGACAAARRLCGAAGAHIGFEEEDFYPALVPLLGEETVRRMRQEHCCGFDVICTLLSRGHDLPLHPDLGERLLAQSEVMEEHIAECGELFAAVRDIPPLRQQALYDRLIEWRQHPKLDLARRTVGCGALRLAQCHPAAIPAGAFERSSLPVSKGLAVRVGSDERRELARMAARLIAEDPALITNDALDPRTGSGIEDGPALFYEDHSEIHFHSDACLDYRSRLLAGDGDMVAIGGQRRPEFEAYCRDLLGIGDAAVVVPRGRADIPLAKRVIEDSALLAQICDVARRYGRLGLVPYLSSESAWTLASAIATQSGAPVWIAGPGPRLTRRVNDKLWFSERVTQLLGRRALPQTHYIFGPEALARRISRLARDHDCVCIKIPDATGGVGNVILEAKQVTEIPLLPLRQFLLQRLYELGWRDRYPLLAGAWESAVVASPSNSALDSSPHNGSTGRGSGVRAGRRGRAFRRRHTERIAGIVVSACRPGGGAPRLPVPGTGLFRTLQLRRGASQFWSLAVDRVQWPLGRGIDSDDPSQPDHRSIATAVRHRASVGAENSAAEL